jgi:aspartyl-tRNA(Asn)/glutamyl-tRNA(Gln) amidotransferase subunit A
MNHYALATYYIIMPAEVSTNLARLDGIRYGLAQRTDTLLGDYVQSRTEGFGAETRRRLLLGTYVLSSGYIDAYYYKARATRSLLRQEYERAFGEVDFILTPTTVSTAFTLGEKSDALSLYLEDLFTVTANLTGMPAISVPIGRVENLPIGAHFTASMGADESLFAMAQIVEKLLGA